MNYSVMVELRVYNLKVDNDFKQLAPPLPLGELQQLEQSIISDGCHEPLYVWNSTLLDGHNRYEICIRNKIPFMLQRINLKNREEAIAWICANKLHQRNVTNETRKYLIGKMYEMEKILGTHSVPETYQLINKGAEAELVPEPIDETAYRTRESLSDKYNISFATVLKYEKYARSLDALARIAPDLVPKILSGEMKISHENIVELSRLSGHNAKRLNQLLSNDATQLIGYLRKILPRRKRSSGKAFILPAASVKDMPAYDPDGEISSLTLTIPSWVSSINRSRSAADFRDVTDNARGKLEKELIELKEAIDSMLTAMKETIS